MSNNNKHSSTSPIDFEFTESPYVNKKYEEFYKKHGYIPEGFNPYNCTEINLEEGIAPTLTTGCGSITGSSSLLIIMEEKE